MRPASHRAPPGTTASDPRTTRLLVVDDDEALRDLLARELSRSGHDVAQAADGAAALARLREADVDVVLLDLMLPDLSGIEVLRRIRAERPGVEVVVLTAHGTIDTALEAMKLGAFDYLRKPCHLQELELTLQRALERGRLGEANARLKDGLSVGTLGPEIVGAGAEFDDLQRLIARVAASESTVLVRGETGTGKELVARSIHRLSRRREEPFVVVDCAALTESLLQSELFGHEQGAFTGATKRKHGLFEAADGGTVFLDEIGDVSPAVQAALLRVLETSTFRHVGGTQQVKVDVRLVAATNRALERLVDEGQFRRDLYFRLNAIKIELKPLRQRRSEIPALVEHFVALHNARHGTRKSCSPAAERVLVAYEWPGNVRQLRHVVERALVLADGSEFTPADLPPELGETTSRLSDRGALTLAEMEKRHIARVLAEVGGHRARAAQLLGISERNLYRKIREHGLDDAP
ncbi:MAG TPA: sigma-54 dependent transcriptional regulator [Anaeromyxobacter sp.]|nr:sigma-54 dependent transcriptional regulator [Anaeromyxobacter sp.]